jgi:hypothetical protein
MATPWRPHGDQSLHRSHIDRTGAAAKRRAHKKAAVTKALKELIARRRQKRLLELMGKLEWDPSYDYKAERDHH